MAVIKHINVHVRPKQVLKYILNGDKNSEMKFASAINCEPDAELAYDAFKYDFEHFSGRRFSINSENLRGGNNSIRMHHYIQSFKPGEVTPEVAHEIGVKWAKKVFGDKFMVVISTHVDKGHIHTHFAVSAYDSTGRKWYANKESMRRCKAISDEIVREYGLSVIEKPKRNHNHSYGEWLARKNGTSWKAKIADAIDRGVADSNVNSVDDLVDYLRRNGYKVNYGKYISVQGPKNRKAIRSFRLGEGYSVEALAYRIAHKETEFSEAAFDRYTGIQREYALCIRRLQIMVYRKDESLRCATYPELLKSAELLKYICDNNITSADGFKAHVDDADEQYRSDKAAADKLCEKISLEEKIVANGARYLEISHKKRFTEADMDALREMDYMEEAEVFESGDIEKHRRKIEPLKAELEAAEEKAAVSKSERDTVGGFYRTYCEQIEGDFAKIKKIIEQERAERQRKERELYDRSSYSRRSSSWER